MFNSEKIKCTRNPRGSTSSFRRYKGSDPGAPWLKLLTALRVNPSRILPAFRLVAFSPCFLLSLQMIMWPLLLLSCVRASPAASSLVGYVGTPTECARAHFVPGYNLGGEGFDVVTMERKGAYVIDSETWKTAANGSCKLYRNGFMNREAQKVPVSVVDWRALPQCSLKVASMLYDSAEALVNDSASSVSNNWKVGLEIPLPAGVSAGVGLGGSHSKESAFGMQKSKQDRYSFSRQSIQCKVYR